MKQWEVTAQLCWDASREKTVVVKANTERSAKKIAKEKLEKEYRNVDILRTKLLGEDK